MRECNSEHIVRYKDSFIENERGAAGRAVNENGRGVNDLWLVMELCDLGSALDVMQRQGKPLVEGDIHRVRHCT